MDGLSGKVIIVTGAAGGLGGATATELCNSGASVVLADIDLAGAERLASTLAGAPGQARAAEFDLTREDTARAVVAFAEAEFGRLDGVHNNAADLSDANFLNDGDVVDISLDVWQHTLDANLTGTLLMLRHAIPALLRHGGGSIVNMSSSAALIGYPARVSYMVTKAGILALTRHVATRWGREAIRCNSVVPGTVLTEAARRVNGHLLDGMLAETPSTRLGEPTDIAGLVAFLLSDRAAWINGQAYGVNGGSLMR